MVKDWTEEHYNVRERDNRVQIVIAWTQSGIFYVSVRDIVLTGVWGHRQNSSHSFSNEDVARQYARTLYEIEALAVAS